MITYTFTFEQLRSGAFKVHFESPPSSDTTRTEQEFAKRFIEMNRAILRKLAGENPHIFFSES